MWKAIFSPRYLGTAAKVVKTVGQQNYFLLAQQCFKVVEPALAHYWHANPPYANDFHNLPMVAYLSVLLGYVSFDVDYTGLFF